MGGKGQSALFLSSTPSFTFRERAKRIETKEYISVIEGTSTAIVLQRFDSPNLSLPALSDGQVVQNTADRAGRGWVSQIFVRRWDVAVPSTSDIYSLGSE